MTAPPISIFTCDVVTPLVTCVTAPLRGLRALIFMAAPVPRMSSNSRNNSKHRVGQNRGNLVGPFCAPTADKTLAAGDQKPGKGGLWPDRIEVVREYFEAMMERIRYQPLPAV